MGFGPALTLRQRALAALARREHSRNELARKLAPHAADRDELEALLDALERERLLSGERFAESLVHRRAARYGSARIARELGEHALPAEVVAESLAGLRETEFERCKAAWERKFGRPPVDLQERARQTRFLAGRGFDAGVIRRVLRGADSD